MDAGSAQSDAREFLAVAGVAAAGLTLAAAVAFVPWYGPAERDGAVVEVRAPAASVAGERAEKR